MRHARRNAPVAFEYRRPGGFGIEIGHQRAIGVPGLHGVETVLDHVMRMVSGRTHALKRVAYLAPPGGIGVIACNRPALVLSFGHGAAELKGEHADGFMRRYVGDPLDIEMAVCTRHQQQLDAGGVVFPSDAFMDTGEHVRGRVLAGLGIEADASQGHRGLQVARRIEYNGVLRRKRGDHQAQQANERLYPQIHKLLPVGPRVGLSSTSIIENVKPVTPSRV